MRQELQCAKREMGESFGISPYFEWPSIRRITSSEDDVTMANDDVMAVDERLSRLETGLSRLETTVATGFHEQRQRTEHLEDRMFGLENKVNVVAESIRSDLRTVLEAVTAGTEEMRRTTDAIRKEHEADRRLARSILQDHSVRLQALEHRASAPQPPAPTP